MHNTVTTTEFQILCCRFKLVTFNDSNTELYRVSESGHETFLGYDTSDVNPTILQGHNDRHDLRKEAA